MLSWLNPGRVPIVVAHRGSSSVAPENTLASFRRAIDDGADAVELDVRLTGDGIVIVIHDEDLRRTCGNRGTVRDRTYRELRSLSAGAWFHRSFAAERIPTLDEVLELTAGRCGVNIEIKTDRRDPQGEEIVNRSFRSVRAHRAQDRVLLSSFSQKIVRNLGTLRPRCATGLLYHPLLHRMKSPGRFAQSLGARYLIMNGSSLRRAIVEDAHRSDLFVGEYTVNSVRRWNRAIRFGVDAVITDTPCDMRGAQ